MRTGIGLVVVLIVGVMGSGRARADDSPRVRRLDYGVIVEAQFGPGDTDLGFAYEDLYRFQGKTGEVVYISAASGSAGPALFLTVNGKPLVKGLVEGFVPKDKSTWGTTGQAEIQLRLPEDGWYQIEAMGFVRGFAKTKVHEAVPYVLAIGRSPVSSDVRFVGLQRGLGPVFHIALGSGVGVVRRAQGTGGAAAFNLSLGFGYQTSPGFGLDLVANTSLILAGPDPGDVLLLSVLVGPRLRLGSKQDGFLGITPALAYLRALGTLPAGSGTIDAGGLGLRVDWALALGRTASSTATWNLVLFAQGQQNGDVSNYCAGLNTTF